MKVVSSLRFPLALLLAVATLSLPIRAFQPGAEVKLQTGPADTEIFQRFGYAADLSGDTAVIGTPRAGFGDGAAYVFVRTATAWQQQARLAPTPTAASAEFGSAVAIDGDTLIVGAPLESGGGAAYVFVRQAGTWSQQARLVPGDAASDKAFGTAVDVSGNTVAIGATGDSGGAFQGGAVYLFERSGTTWSQTAKKLAPSPGPGDLLGFSVSLDGDSLVAGAPFADTPGQAESGLAVLFQRGPTGWQSGIELRPANGSGGDQFGWSVAVSGDLLIAGAPRRAGGGTAYAFTRTATAWPQTAQFLPANTDADQLFGYSVAIDGGELIIGAPLDNGFATLGGAAYFYHLTAGAWAADARIAASDVAENDQFGFAVALSGRQALVASPFAGGLEIGAGYLYSARENTPPQADSKSVTTLQDTPVSITLSGSDPENQPLTFSISTPPAWGTLSGTPPNLTYTPNPGVSGSDSFAYVANDGSQDSPPATVSISITPAKQPPVAIPQDLTIDEDTGIEITLTGSSSDNSPLAYEVLTPPTTGKLTGTPPILTYTPDRDYNGSDAFTFRVLDGNLASTPATVAITITPRNDPPTINPIPTQTGVEGQPVGPIPILIADIDDDVGSLLLAGESDNQDLVPDRNLLFSGAGGQRWLTITPAPGRVGRATIVLTVSDARSSSSTSFLLIIEARNQPPVADASASTREAIAGNNLDAAVTLDGSRSSDADGDPLSFQWRLNGTVLATTEVAALRLPVGIHEVTLTVNDGQASATDTIRVEILDLTGAINRLIAAIQRSTLPDSVKTDLVASLRAAAKLSEKGNFIPVDKTLAATENKILAQIGKKIPRAQGEALLQAVGAIRASLR